LNAGEFVPSVKAEAIPFDGSKRTPRLSLLEKLDRITIASKIIFC
jgi:hypothetical protein